MSKKANFKRDRAKLRVRTSIKGKNILPRLTVYKSNKFTYCQLLDDNSGVTLASASTTGLSGTKIEQAKEAGKMLASKAVSLDVDKIVFDRSGYIYHGRIKALAEGAREGGLKF